MLALILFIYFVSFADKPQTDTPALSERALEQRAKWNIEIDALDYPVSTVYLDSLRRLGVQIHHTSRWFNGATCEMSESQVTQVQTLSFVTEVQLTRDNSSPIYGAVKRSAIPGGSRSSRLSGGRSWTDEQLDLFNLRPLHDAGFEGQGILMAICDGAFYKANTMSCFRHEQELGHFDFTDDADDFYGSSGAHGMECLSTISGIQDDFYGAATRANYYLMRSEEMPSESPKEMDNLVAALEKADSLGVNVFSVSLGYAYFDNDAWTVRQEDLDGKTYRCSRAATIAARKGMLVCVAAGNDGNKEWHTISVPADADSILTVGAVDTDSVIGAFSSFGPSADGRIKPEVCAVGAQTTLINPNGTIVTSNGTSYATPLIAGLAASLWSALPDENSMQIRERILQSSNRYRNPDMQQYGYGIPDAWKAYTMALGVQNTEHSVQNTDTRKILHGDQILIVRFGHIYNLAGQRVQ